MRLDERYKRKDFVIDRDMLNLKRLTVLDKTLSKEQKEIYNLMKPFARFNTPQDHEKLVQGIIKERQLRARIDTLSFYIKIGLTNNDEVEEYKMAERQKREYIQKKTKKMGGKHFQNKRVSRRRKSSRRAESPE
jgi:transcriptional adapter 2-alpha